MPSSGNEDVHPTAKEEKEAKQEEGKFEELRVSGAASSDEYPLLVTMPSGEKVRICCKPTDTILEIKKALWAAESLREDMSSFILRLRNAETYYQDKQVFRDLLGHFLLFREESFHDTLEAVLMDKRDIGDSDKRKTKIPTTNGLNRAQGFLKKKGSGATHKWQERYFVLQDNTLFYFGSYEDYDRRLPASEAIPMGSCIAEVVTQGRPVHLQSSSLGALSGGDKTPPPLSRQTSTGRKVHVRVTPELKAPAAPVRYIFRLAADAVGKREFLLRTKSAEVLRLFVHAIQSLNLQRIKLIVLDTTKELLDRTNRDLVVSSQISESKEAQAVLRAYAYAQYPKLKGLDDLVLSEVLCSALGALEAPLLSAAFAQGFHKIGLERITPQQIKILQVQNIPPAYRSLFEYLISFFHTISSRPQTTGVSAAYIAKLMEEAMFGPPDPFIRALDRVGVLQALIEKRPSLWPLTVEAHMQELRPAIFAATPLPNRLRRPPSLEVLATPKAKERRSSRIQLGPTKAKDKAEGKKARVSCVQFPLTFHFAATSETGPQSIDVRTLEELVAVESRPFSPGRFYAMDDLLHPRLGNQLGCSHEMALGQSASHLCMLEYCQKQVAFVPEVVALGYLFQRGNLSAMTQLTSYLAYRQPLPKKPNDIPTEPSFMDRTRGRTLASLEEKADQPRKSSRASRYDDDDDFVDIDTSAPPLETPRYGVQPSPRAGKWEPPEWKKPASRRAPPPPPLPAATQPEEDLIPPPPADDQDAPPSSGTACPHDDPQVYCAECKEALCSICDEALHQGEKASHERGAFKAISIAIIEPKDEAPPPPPEQPTLTDDSVTQERSITESSRYTRSPSDSLNEHSLNENFRYSHHSRTNSSSHNSRHSPQTSMADASHLKVIEREAGEKVLKPITFGMDSSFESVMRFGEARNCFRKFLATEFAEENILFWDEVNKFCEADVHTQYKLAQYIFATYFGPQAVKQVNVRGMFAQLKDALGADEAEAVAQCTFLFLEAQTAVVQLLKYDCFSRFKTSPMWHSFVDNFKQREWVRFKVVKMKKMHKNVVRVIQFDSNSMALTFFKPDHEGEYTQEELRVPAGSLVNVQLSVTNNKKLKLTFFKTDQRLLRNQKEWRLIFRTTAERERLARVITSNLLLKQSSATQRAAYQPQPLIMERKTLQALTMLPVEDVACALHEYYVSGKKSEGWVYGETYSDEEKTDPNLISWQHMGEKERAYDFDVASLIIGSILELGFTVSPQSYEEPPTDLEEDSRLLLLVEFLSENTHDCWAAKKIKQGWVYGETRSEQEKTHPNLIPYVDLQEADMDWNRQAAIQVLRALTERGFKIEPVE